MGLWKDLIGIYSATLQFVKGGPKIKASGGSFSVRNAADNADTEFTASKLNNSGDVLVLNSDAAEAAADWKLNLARPAAGMTADWTLTLPTTPGTAGQVLSTDGGGNGSWVSAASTAACDSVDVTNVAFGSTSPITMFTLPANAVVDKVQVVVDTAFDGTPSLSIGKAGTTSKYMASTQNDLTAAADTVFEVSPGLASVGTTEALIATYSAGGATVGAARINVFYSVPS